MSKEELEELEKRKKEYEEYDDLELGIDIDEIIPDFLYLGDYYSSQREKALKRRGINIVLNITDEKKETYEGIEYHQFKVYDWISQDLSETIQECIKILEEAYDSKPRKRVYVHCHQGISRSSSVVIAYIMKTKKIGYDEALKFVKEKRDLVAPNLGFIKQLRKLEEE